MTLISQFKSKFKTDCKAMSYVLACGLTRFISEHLTRRIKRRSPRAQPAVCQIFKYPGMQKSLSHFPTSKLTTTPYFPISFWLTYILSRRPACLTLLSAVRGSLTSRFLTPAADPVCAAECQPVQTKPWGAVSSLCFLEVDLKGWLGRYLLQSEYRDKRVHDSP